MVTALVATATILGIGLILYVVHIWRNAHGWNGINAIRRDRAAYRRRWRCILL